MLSVLSHNPIVKAASLNAASVQGKHTQSPKFAANTVTVMGNGFVTKTADRARSSVSIQEEGKDQAALTKKVTEKASALMEAVKAIHPDFDLSSSGVRVHEKSYYDQKTGQHKKDGFTASFQLTVTDKSANVDDLKARAAQINQVALDQKANFGGTYGYLSERRQASGAREALAMAYTDALKKANKIAKTAGHTLETLPVSVVENGAQQADFGGRPMAKRAMAMAASLESADAPGGGVSEELFNFNPHTINAPTITVVYDIKSAAPQSVNCEGPTCGAGKLDAKA